MSKYQNTYNVFLTNSGIDVVLADGYETEDGLIKFYNDIPKYDYSGTSCVGFKKRFNGTSYNISCVKKIINLGIQ